MNKKELNKTLNLHKKRLVGGKKAVLSGAVLSDESLKNINKKRA